MASNPGVESGLAKMPAHVRGLTMEVWKHSADPTGVCKLSVVVHPETQAPVILTSRPFAPGEIMLQMVVRDTELVVPVIPELGGEGALHPAMLLAMSMHNRDTSPAWASVFRHPSVPATRASVLQGVPPTEGSMRLLSDPQVAQVSSLFKCLAGARGWESYHPVLAGVANGPSVTIVPAPGAEDPKAVMEVAVTDQSATGRTRMHTNLVLCPLVGAVPRTVDREGQETGARQTERAKIWDAADKAAAAGRGPPPRVPGVTGAPSELQADLHRKLVARVLESPDMVLPNTYVDVLYYVETEKADSGLPPGSTSAMGVPAPEHVLAGRPRVSVVLRLISRRYMDAGEPLVRAAHYAEPQFAGDRALQGHTRLAADLLKITERACTACVSGAATVALTRVVPPPPDGAYGSDAHKAAIKAALEPFMLGLSAKATVRVHAPPFVGGLPPTQESLFKDVMGVADTMTPVDAQTVHGKLAMGQGAVVVKIVESAVTYLVGLGRWLATSCEVDEAAWAGKHSLWRSMELMAAIKDAMTASPETRTGFQTVVTALAKGLADDATPEDVRAALDTATGGKPTSWDTADSVTEAKQRQFDVAAGGLLAACGLSSLDWSPAGGAEGAGRWRAVSADFRRFAKGELTGAAKGRIMQLVAEAATV